MATKLKSPLRLRRAGKGRCRVIVLFDNKLANAQATFHSVLQALMVAVSSDDKGKEVSKLHTILSMVY